MSTEFTLDGVGEDKKLTARFPEVHEDAEAEIYFQRTLRVPDDGKVYPLPAGREPFPLRHLEEFTDKLPATWHDRGGVIMPMYKGEAMWMQFDERYPCAIKIGAGDVNVLNGRRWTKTLDGSACDYIAAPPQAALDGYCTKKDVVRQFVAMPLGEGYSVEEQITGRARRGGIEIIVYPMKKERYEELRAERAQQGGGDWSGNLMNLAPSPDFESGPGPEPVPHALAAGGHMRQRIATDPYGIDAWDQSNGAHCIVTLVDVDDWGEITGARPPTRPFTPADYEKEGLPWFDLFNDDLEAQGDTSGLARVASVTEIAARRGLRVLPVATIEPSEPVRLRPVRPPRRSRDPRPSVRALWGAIGLLRR